MAGAVGGGMPDLEKELTCAICTEILYQPLTLLDCLHTFCGACLKEWFTWQAASAASSRRTTQPYTCPSCREAVRGTKADWRLTTLLEGYLKANPDKAKSDAEKEDIRKHFTPGENVLLPVRQASQDELRDQALLDQVSALSLGEVNSRQARQRRDLYGPSTGARHTPEDPHRRQQSSQWAARRAQLTESRLLEHDANEPRIEHQPSLRSLLSASDGEPHDVQAEILQSIYAEGLLEGVDLDHLTPQQEEELTERIAEAYRRRQRRDQPRNREHRHGNRQSSQVRAADVSDRNSSDPRLPEQQHNRSHPPTSLSTHAVTGQSSDPSRAHRRSASATRQWGDLSTPRTDGTHPAARSATDLSQRTTEESAQRHTRDRLANTGRSVTDPQGGREVIHRYRASSRDSRDQTAAVQPSDSRSDTQQAVANERNPTTDDSSILPHPRSPPATTAQHTVRPEASMAAFAPEALTTPTLAQAAPSIQCYRCQRPHVQHDLHYNCARCLNGALNLCMRCYRDGRGCEHWFGFGFRAYERWYRNAPPEGYQNGHDRPHTLAPRKYVRAQKANTNARAAEDVVQEGAFCESCFSFCNDHYWYCNVCLDGAWGFCSTCVNQGKHCTHPLLAVAHSNTLSQHQDPSKQSFVGLPHLRQDSYVALPVTTGCDICQRPIPPSTTRYHCHQCNEGDYDVDEECYRGLMSQGKIAHANGPDGWRRCLNGHRMSVLGNQQTYEGGHLRIIVRQPVGGASFKEDDSSRTGQIPPASLPPDGGVGLRCLALYSYFPQDAITDELAFPKNAEVREVEKLNDDWYSGVYAGRIGLFPSNHVRVL